ncbi:HAD family hydrolase [Paenibacillus protaetiae]|uniref:HAD family hydrolase n=1 Tax=Paenibacillus protaetiae TaxID=2509456 RepID=A0A4P6EVL8_9BACL|nr:HAD family hydrolase [Paenibacillus protaetiae]QAY67082.1 HAD family hydrolase [Paenibacillus protaetiae]
MTVKAYVTDLDGTLLHSDQTVSEYTQEVAAKLQEQGIIFTYATARSYTSSNKAAGVISWKEPFILYNGALIYDSIAGQVIDGYWLDSEMTNRIMGVGRKHGITPLLFTLDEDSGECVLHERLEREGDLKFRESRKGDPRFQEREQLVCPDGHRTLTVTYIGLREELEPILQEVTDVCGPLVHAHFMKDYYIEHHYFLEFSHAYANKKEGLKLWAKHMGISPGDITVFGDNLNDRGLFEAAGTKVAVRNAHDAIIAMADVITGSNNEDGVAKYLADKLLR